MSEVRIANPHVAELSVDSYYHLGLDSSMPLKELFGDIKYVFFAGTNDRVKAVAQSLADAFWPVPLGQSLTPIGGTSRYHMFKVGQVITCSHQMGMPSFSILLHEMTKLLAAAGATDVTYIRVGTSGGVGMAPGTLVVTRRPLNGFLQPEYPIISLGKTINRPALLSETVRNDLLEAAASIGVTAVAGDTMSVDCFYEGQGRLDGAICEYNEDDKFAFLKRACDEGVRNIEMESVMFGAFCTKVGIEAGVICCVIINRLLGDQVAIAPEKYHDFVEYLTSTCVALVAKKLNLKVLNK